MNKAGSYKEVAGIIGGIGPEATSYFISLLISLRSPFAHKDQDHIPFLLFNNPQIPDRTEYLLEKNDTSPLPEIIRTGIALKKAGARFLVMPCNTIHAFAQEIEEKVGLPLINMIDETAISVQRTYGNNVTVGVLATTGTIQSRLYQHSFRKTSRNITVLTPPAQEQALIMQAIYSIKSVSVNEWNTQILFNAANRLYAKGASVIILGCTEIPLALQEEKYKFFRVDPMEVLAQKVIERSILSKSVKPYHSLDRVMYVK